MSKEQKPGAYDDIIDLPHHVSTTRPQMSRLDRAAQFAPFARADWLWRGDQRDGTPYR